jgi:hypothetical protein
MAARVPGMALCASDGRRILLCRCDSRGKLRERAEPMGDGGRARTAALVGGWWLLSRGGSGGSRGF